MIVERTKSGFDPGRPEALSLYMDPAIDLDMSQNLDRRTQLPAPTLLLI
jgi:hypothetical protein